MSDWQPIETAPKDGTDVDLWCVSDDGYAARVSDSYWIGPAEPSEGGGFGYWHGVLLPAKATHWMPLPEPPEANERKGLL